MRFAIPDSLVPRGGVVAFALLASVVWTVAAPDARAQTVPPPQDPIPSANDTIYRNVGFLRPGDELAIVVFRDKELSGKYIIDSRGMLQMPGLGVLRVAGLDPTQVSERLRDALLQRGFASPEISVQPLIRVGVLGQVRTPGVLSVEPGTNLLQLLTIAGGPQEDANLRRTRVMRDGRVHVVDLESAMGGSAAGRIVLYSGDYIEVPRRSGLTRENLTFLLGSVSALLTLVNVIVTLNRT